MSLLVTAVPFPSSSSRPEALATARPRPAAANAWPEPASKTYSSSGVEAVSTDNIIPSGEKLSR